MWMTQLVHCDRGDSQQHGNMLPTLPEHVWVNKPKPDVKHRHHL